MPPQTGSRKARQPAKPKQAGRPVVPAIPLPHVKRQAAAAAAAAATKPPGTPKPVLKDENTVATDQAKSQSPTDSTGHSSELASELAVTKSSSPATISEDSSPIVKAEKKRAESNRRMATEAKAEIIPRTTVEEVNVPDQSPQKYTNGTGSSPRAVLSDEATAGSTKPQAVPPVSPARYQMPPKSHPGQSHPSIVAKATRGNLPQDPINAAQSHLGNGHARFGSFSGSGSSSPAPHIGGFVPPPGMPLSNGVNAYPAPERTDYLPVMPHVRDGMPMAGLSPYDRSGNSYGSTDHRPAYNFNHVPSPATQNYQDSHSSVTQEETSAYQQGPQNGTAGLPDGMPPADGQGTFFGGSEHPGWMPSHMPPPGSIVAHIEETQGVILHTQQHFGSPEFADCALELRPRGGIPTASPLPAHRLVLSRSPVLKDLIHKQGLRPGPVDQPWYPPVVVETDNKWIRPETFHLAVQNLYGFPLFRAPPQARVPDYEGIVTGSVAERLHYALSYAAAGHILAWGPVVRRGCEIACQLLDASTVESVVEFALEHYCDKGAYEEYKYGDGSAALLHAVVMFIINSLHPSFKLDTSATSDSRTYARLPLDSASIKASDAPDVSPIIARGSSATQLPKGIHHQSHPSIQFGDLTIGNGQIAEGHRDPENLYRVSDTLISRILLNLPFGVLKMFIESGIERANGWTNPGARYRLVQEIIGEREARRARSLEAVVSGAVADAAMIQESLRNPEPRVPRWGALGWHEEVTTHGDSDGLVLQRQWTPFKSVQTGNLAEFP